MKTDRQNWFTLDDPRPTSMDVIIKFRAKEKIRDSYGYPKYTGKTYIAERRGLYFKIWDSWSVPPKFALWDGVLMPHGWGGTRFEGNAPSIIAWRHATEHEIKNRER